MLDSFPGGDGVIRLNRAVIVEGRYDKTALENVIDATIIPTNGFQIFKDREKCALIRALAQRDGVIVMTDSDSAGQMIRSYLKKICGTGELIHVCVPQIKGCEKRKRAPGKAGLLGVEGMKPEILLAALERSGVTADTAPERQPRLTKGDLFRLGLSGRENSALLRRELARFLELPADLSANAFLDIVNTVYTPCEFEERVRAWRQESDRR